MNGQSPQSLQFTTLYDPYVYQTLNTIIGTNIVVQTTRNSLQGKLTTVMPDHIVVEINQTPFFIRTQQIIWVSPS
ncbi:YuzF family protein [Jeotgalibacillus sp. ET6]|uniref:YuzF family protein n=1 Tax=Jeotgalibacillus TaxID=157226 RepID=UPI0024183ABC|nr:YuzF family protein [Jeotgalibacillus sp. ET6]MDG5472761.1 YuzF family protein [Jeotgalibacillus sp. ET6]